MLHFITTVKELELNKILILAFLLLYIAGCSQAQESDQKESVQQNLLHRIINQCSNLDISDSIQWKIKLASDGYYNLEYQSLSSNEFLNLYVETDSSEIRGYYNVETDNNYLNFRLSECDTTIYFEIRQTTKGIDTVFYIGYYKYLFDKNLLTEGQRRYFTNYRDSLTFVVGDSLQPLPEMGKVIPAENPGFEPIDN